MNFIQTNDASSISAYVRAMERLFRVIQDLSASRDLTNLPIHLPPIEDGRILGKLVKQHLRLLVYHFNQKR